MDQSSILGSDSVPLVTVHTAESTFFTSSAGVPNESVDDFFTVNVDAIHTITNFNPALDDLAKSVEAVFQPWAESISGLGLAEILRGDRRENEMKPEDGETAAQGVAKDAFDRLIPRIQEVFDLAQQTKTDYQSHFQLVRTTAQSFLNPRYASAFHGLNTSMKHQLGHTQAQNERLIRLMIQSVQDLSAIKDGVVTFLLKSPPNSPAWIELPSALFTIIKHCVWVRIQDNHTLALDTISSATLKSEPMADHYLLPEPQLRSQSGPTISPSQEKVPLVKDETGTAGQPLSPMSPFIPNRVLFPKDTFLMFGELFPQISDLDQIFRSRSAGPTSNPDELAGLVPGIQVEADFIRAMVDQCDALETLVCNRRVFDAIFRTPHLLPDGAESSLTQVKFLYSLGTLGFLAYGQAVVERTGQVAQN